MRNSGGGRLGLVVLLVSIWYAVPSGAAAADESTEYLLITSRELAPAFRRLVDYHSAEMSGAVITVQEIASSELFPGRDTPEKIRECIRWHWRNKQTRCVAIGGDDTIVPVRHCLPKPTGTLISTDLYFADMDGGNWDADGDGVLGEPEDVGEKELTPELAFGRIPVRTPDEARDYIAKLRRYHQIPGGSGFSDSLLVVATGGEVLTADAAHKAMPGTQPARSWAARYIYRYYGNLHAEIKAVPTHFLVQFASSWDRDFAGEYTINRVSEKLNQGYHFVFQHGHGKAGKWVGFGLTTSEVMALTNEHPSIVFSAGCNTADYDSKRDPCMSEAWIRNAHGGAVAYFGFAGIGGTAMGWNNYLFPLAREVCGPNRRNLGSALKQTLSEQAALIANGGGNLTFQYKFVLHGDPAIVPLPRGPGRKLQLTTPFTREEYASGEKVTIRWSAGGAGFTDGDRVRLEYSADGGHDWQPIRGADALPFADQAFVWDTSNLTPGADYRLRVTSIEEPQIAHASSVSFSIMPMAKIEVDGVPSAGPVVG